MALQPSHRDVERDSAELHAGDSDASGLHPTEHGHEGPGLASEIVLSAIVAIGVMLATCSALYFAGAFSVPSHGAPAPGVPAQQAR